MAEATITEIPFSEFLKKQKKDREDETKKKARTDKVQASKGSDSGTVYLNSAGTVDSYSGNTASTIIVMEVSA